jgi:membrane protease YdiL (CAAX protease family)
MLFAVAAQIARSAMHLYLTRGGYESSVAADLSYFVILPVTAFLMWPILRENGPAMRHWFRPPVSWPHLIAYSVLLGVLFRVIHWAWLTAGIAFGWFYNPDFPIVATAQLSFACPPVALLALAVAVQAIVTPLAEEFIHRGYVLYALFRRSKIFAVVLSAVFFGLMHRPHTIVNAFLIGLALAVLTFRLRALWGPIIVHATFNLAAIIDWDCFHANWNPAVTTPRHTVIAYISVVTMLTCVAFSLWLLRMAKAGTQIAPRP